jgi:hypothetical protein
MAEVAVLQIVLKNVKEIGGYKSVRFSDPVWWLQIRKIFRSCYHHGNFAGIWWMVQAVWRTYDITGNIQ